MTKYPCFRLQIYVCMIIVPGKEEKEERSNNGVEAPVETDREEFIGALPETL